MMIKPKYERIRELLKKDGIDGAIISSPENFHYVSGFAGHQHTVSRQPGFSLAVLSTDANVPMQLATMDFEIPTFEKKVKALGENFAVRKYDTWVGVKTWGEIAKGEILPDPASMESSNDVLKKIVNDLNLSNKKIGIELEYLNCIYYNMLKKAFPEAEFIDISQMFVYARSVKTEDEILMFTKLCEIADEGFYKVSQMVKAGVTEKEMAAVFRESVTASGFCIPSSWSMFSTGPNGARLTLPDDGVIADDHVVKFDAGVNAEFDFYTTDTSRAWVMKEAAPELHRLKDRLYEGQRRMIAAAKPGMPIKELYQTAYQYVKEAYPCYRRGHQGHSISLGPATAEAPYINASCERLLESGMVLAMEVPCYIRDCNGFNIEDMVLITDNGAKVLTPKTPHYLD